jgi:hypothetical protein
MSTRSVARGLLTWAFPAVRPVDGRAATPAMIDTPRRVLSRRARYGHWARFPSNPVRFFERFRPRIERKGFVSKGQTFAITERLQRRLRDLDGPRRTLPDRLALYRAFHAAGLELADIADESYGAIGELRTDAWHTYLGIDWRATGIDPADYWQDLCELLVWEPYAVDHGAETAWFGVARADEVDLTGAALLALEREHNAAVLDHAADTALERLADLDLATLTRDRYPRATGRLGSRAWRPVEQMARSLLDAGDRDAAVELFRAADQPGMHQAHLRRRCQELTGVELTTPMEDRS